MSIFELIALVLTVAAVLGFLNQRYFQLPTTIGIMLLSMAFSLVLILAGTIFPGVKSAAESIVGQIDFEKALLNVMLSYLLFAGALHVNLGDLAKQKAIIALMSTFGVVASTFLIGTVLFYLLPLLGIEIKYSYCLLFGALISPTDPVAVLGILKNAGVPDSLKTKISGESLFNDGLGVVVFLAILGIATGEHDLSFGHVAHLFLVEAVGGVALGLVLGFVCYYMLKAIENYQMEVIISLALVTGGYALAQAFQLSGPLAMVVSGLMMGNKGHTLAMSESTRNHLDRFWEMIDEVLNALLFTLIGLELIVVAKEVQPMWILAGFLTILMVLGARAVSVAIPVMALRPFHQFSNDAIKMLTWGGLRGGISIALALALPADGGREVFLTITYIVVVFSISVQGLTIGKLYRRLGKLPEAQGEEG